MVLVNLESWLPGAIFDIRYATTNNLTGKILYTDNSTRLDERAAQQLTEAAKLFQARGFKIVVFDAYRPVEVQKMLLEFDNQDTYVLSDSNHPKGLAIDLTLADDNGKYLDMGTDFDEFTPKAHVGAGSLTNEQIDNRKLLSDIMIEVGFRQWPYEWWHFDFTHSQGH
jgi:D-alanyl-D-alanine dipeptidase